MAKLSNCQERRDDTDAGSERAEDVLESARLGRRAEHPNPHRDAASSILAGTIAEGVDDAATILIGWR